MRDGNRAGRRRVNHACRVRRYKARIDKRETWVSVAVSRRLIVGGDVQRRPVDRQSKTRVGGRAAVVGGANRNRVRSGVGGIAD